MKFLVVALLAASVCQSSALFGKDCAFGKPWPRNSLKAKYSLLPINSYYNLPKSDLDEYSTGYQMADNPEGLGFPGYLWCMENDARVCMIMDKQGKTIGTQISYLEDDVKGVQGYDYSAVDGFIKTNYFNTSAYSLRVFHVDPETLTEDGSALSDQTAEGLWVKLNGVWEHLPATDPKVGKLGNFNKQACFPQMGQHYFYKMSASETDCTKHIPFFGMYHNGGLVGYGVANYGKGSTLNREWYESVPLLGVKMIMPDRPSCVDDLVNQNGLYSLHVYFVENPFLIGCLFQ